MEKRDKIKVSEMKKVIGYIRTSTNLQSNSVEMQKHKIKDYCEMNNLILDELILDEGLSGKDIKNRKGFNSVIEMIENKELDTLIVLSLSRMGRNLSQNYKIIDKMKKNKINLISLKENIDLSNAMGRFFVNIMNSLYEMERDMISERVTDVLKDKKRNGKVYGKVPYGYDRSGVSLVRNVKEQKTLKKIYSLISKGNSYAKVSEFLNRNKHTKKNGTKFNRSDVFYIVKTDRKEIALSV